MKIYVCSLGLVLLFFGMLFGNDGVKFLQNQDVELGVMLLQQNLSRRMPIKDTSTKNKINIEDTAKSKNLSTEIYDPRRALIRNQTNAILGCFLQIIGKNKVLLGEALLACCKKNLVAAAIYLINTEAPLDYYDENRHNILHILAAYGNREINNILFKTLNNSAQESKTLFYNLLSSTDIDGKMPIEIAYASCNLDFIEAFTNSYNRLKIDFRCKIDYQE